jgi:hypothetical protein
MKKDDVKTPEQIQKEEQLKKVQERQEKIVIFAREKLLPILKTKNLSIDQSKMVCELLAIALNQGQMELLAEHKVADLKLLDFIQDKYPQSETVREIINTINESPMNESINGLQWMVEKMNKMIEDENKNRKFEELKMEL